MRTETWPWPGRIGTRCRLPSTTAGSFVWPSVTHGSLGAGGVEGEFVATVGGQSEVAGVVVLKLFQKAVNMYANVALMCHNLII